MFWCQSFGDIVHYTFSLVWVYEWPTFGKKLPARLVISSHYLLAIFVFVFVYVFLFISHFGFKSGIWFLIALVPVHCF